MNINVSQVIDQLDLLNQEIETAMEQNNIAALTKASGSCHHFLKNHFPINFYPNDALKEQVSEVLEKVLSTHNQAQLFVVSHKNSLEAELHKIKKDAVNINQYLNVSRECQ